MCDNKAVNTKTLYLAAGCFWGVQGYFSRLDGVMESEVGYANGNTENPTYEAVCHENTDHVEVVKLIYAPEKLSLAQLLQHFLRIVEPCSINQQGNDCGRQYRSGLYYENQEDMRVMQQTLQELQTRLTQKVAIELLPLAQYFTAEAYHQAYLANNPQGYCHIALHLADTPLSALEMERARLAELAAHYQQKAYQKADAQTLREQLSPQSYAVTQEDATEAPYSHAYNAQHEAGIYVDIVSGEPLFASQDKFDAGCGWPSFAKPLFAGSIEYKADHSLARERTEVRSAKADSHLGHVFDDGLPEMGGQRYCINGAALRFIPLSEMAKEGYGDLIELIEENAPYRRRAH